MGIQQKVLRLGLHTSKISENKNACTYTHTVTVHTRTHKQRHTVTESFSHLFHLADLLICVYLKIRDTADVR